MRNNQYLSRRPMILGLAKVLFLAIAELPLVKAAPHYVSHVIWSQEKEEPKPASDPSLWLYLGVAAFLVLAGGAFAGLTIALMGQDEIYLQVIKDSGEGKEKVHAHKVWSLLQRGKHWVLVTLLLSNVITNETLPIVLDRSLGGGWPAVLGSTVLIVIFGEVVPQSICVRYGLPIGAWMAPFVLVLMYIMAPVAWPTAKLLDYLLGEDHGTVYKKAGLKTLVSLHRSLGDAGQRLHADEVTIISAVLDLKEKSIGSIMTPMDDVFTLSLDDVLDEETMDDILSQGYSRIPVHHPDNDDNFVGMLLVKMLITYDPEDAKPVRDFALATLPETKPDTSCLDIVNFFQEGKSHMVLVSHHPGEDTGALGVVTLEDVIEELIGEEIVDESDVYIDIHKAIRRITPAPRHRYSNKSEKPGLARKLSNLVPAPDLIDIAEDQTLDVQRVQTTDTLPPTAVHIPHDPRRASSHSIAGDSKAAKRAANLEEVKEHLKHLGPSNLASRPKTTRYASVKIKPGMEANANQVESPLERTTLPRRISEGASDFGGGIGEGLVKSGGKEASDGVQALAHGYGTLSASPNNRRPMSVHKAVQADAVQVDGELERTPTQSPRENGGRPKPFTIDSDSAVEGRAYDSRPKSPYYHGGPARSGSITENIVDTNGIRKVVLETTSSSESNEEDNNGGANIHQRTSSQSNAGSTSKGHDASKPHQHADHDDNTVTKKRRRRRKKGRPGKGDEMQPLLEHDD